MFHVSRFGYFLAPIGSIILFSALFITIFILSNDWGRIGENTWKVQLIWGIGCSAPMSVLVYVLGRLNWVRQKYHIAYGPCLVLEFCDELLPDKCTGAGFIMVPRLSFVSRLQDYYSGTDDMSGAISGRMMVKTNQPINLLTPRDIIDLLAARTSYIGTNSANAQSLVNAGIDVGDAKRDRNRKNQGVIKAAGVGLIVGILILGSCFHAQNGYGTGGVEGAKQQAEQMVP